jgi:hypothetical protein
MANRKPMISTREAGRRMKDGVLIGFLEPTLTYESSLLPQKLLPYFAQAFRDYLPKRLKY